jgi:hypothetical protein
MHIPPCTRIDLWMWIRQFADLRICGFADLRICGFVDLWICGFVAIPFPDMQQINIILRLLNCDCLYITMDHICAMRTVGEAHTQKKKKKENKTVYIIFVSKHRCSGNKRVRAHYPNTTAARDVISPFARFDRHTAPSCSFLICIRPHISRWKPRPRHLMSGLITVIIPE